MSSTFDFDRRVTALLEEQAAPHAPDALLAQVTQRVSRTRHRPAWATLERWIPMETRSQFGAVPRTAIILVILGILLAFASAIVAGQQPSKLPAPYGQAANGLIAFDAQIGIFAIDEFGHDQRRIFANGKAAEMGPIFSPDGRRVALWQSQEGGFGVVVADADGSEPVLVSEEVDASPVAQEQVSWSPDSQRLAFSGMSDGRKSLFTVNADGSGLQAITDGSVDATYPAWSPGGSVIAFRGRLSTDQSTNGIYVVDTDGQSQRMIHPTPGFGRDQSPPVWSPDGRRLIFDAPAASGSGHDIVRIEVEDARSEAVAADTLDECCPTWAPDGSQIAFLRGDYPNLGPTGAWEYDLIVADPDGSDPRLIQGPKLEPGTPSWSPDGRKVLAYGIYDTDPAVAYPVIIITLDGSLEPVTVPANVASLGSWQRLAR
jgi:Tol biopolymer transport system component